MSNNGFSSFFPSACQTGHTLSVFGADQDQGDIKNSYSTFCSKSGTWLRERNNGTPEIREILEKKLKDMGGKYVSE